MRNLGVVGGGGRPRNSHSGGDRGSAHFSCGSGGCNGGLGREAGSGRKRKIFFCLIILQIN